MKYYVSALIATAVFAQDANPQDCCKTMPRSFSCLGCEDMAATFAPVSTQPDCCTHDPRGPRCYGCDTADANGISASDATALIGGVLAGAKIQSVDDIATCIKDADPLVAHIDNAADGFDDGSVEKMNDGVNELGKFFAQLATDMEGCGKLSSDDVTLLKNISDAFLHPQKPDVQKKICKINGVNIYNDMMAADYDYESE